MKNAYIAIGVIVIIIILAFVLGKEKIEAPQAGDLDGGIATTSAAATDGIYRIDTGQSSIGWKGEFVTGMSEQGTVMLKSGSATVTNGIVSGGSFVVDMATIKDSGGKANLENHLKNDDFFAVSEFPESSFVITSVAPSSEDGARAGRYVIGGNLTVRGITKPVSFLATVKNIDQNTIEAKSTFAINRADWNVKYNSQTFFSNLGDKVIRDAVEITLDLKAVRE